MFNIIIENFKHLNNTTYKIMMNGFKFCFILSIISCIIMLAYIFMHTSPSIYYIGFNLLKSSICFAVEFIICGIVVDNIINNKL